MEGEPAEGRKVKVRKKRALSRSKEVSMQIKTEEHPQTHSFEFRSVLMCNKHETNTYGGLSACNILQIKLI